MTTRKQAAIRKPIRELTATELEAVSGGMKINGANRTITPQKPAEVDGTKISQ